MKRTEIYEAAMTCGFRATEYVTCPGGLEVFAMPPDAGPQHRDRVRQKAKRAGFIYRRSMPVGLRADQCSGDEPGWVYGKGEE